MQQPPSIPAFDVNASSKEAQIAQRLTLQSWKAYITDLKLDRVAAAKQQPFNNSINEKTNQ